MLAVIGTSRLPITSLEAPLPAFSLGQLAYFPNLVSRELSSWVDPVCMLGKALADRLGEVEMAKVLETTLRATADPNQGQVLHVLDAFVAGSPLGAQQIGAIVTRLFQHVALSPYTEFVDRLMARLRTGRKQLGRPSPNH